MADTIRSAFAVGRDEFEVTGYLPFIKKFSYTVAELDDVTLTIPVKAGQWVLGVAALVTTAFDGTPSLDVGDSDNADGYIDSTDPDIDLTSLNAFYCSFGAADTELGAGGKYYAANSMILVDMNATSPTVGALDIYVLMAGMETNPRESWMS